MKLSYMLCAVLMFATVPGISDAAPLTAQDYVEIQQLYAKYNHAIDNGNAEEWADTFTPDGVFNGRFTGREALMGFIKTWRERMNGGSRRHWNSNLMLTGSTDSVAGAVYLMLLDVSTKPASVVSTGVYSDELAKTANGWRFKSRVVKSDAPAAATAPAK
jgi:SnoaL-like domain